MSRDRSRKDHPDYRRGYRDGRLYGTGHNHGRAAGGGGGGRRGRFWFWLLLQAATIAVLLGVVAECAS
jgi:hypothetical protein